MPTGRLTMRRIRDVLRLKFSRGLSERAIAASLGLGKGSVGTYLRRARDAGLSWPLSEGLDDDSLELHLFPGASSVADPNRPVPDWSMVDKELRKRGVTRMLLWQEYREHHPGGFGYTWFCTHFDAWKGRVRPSMRQTHVGGEKVFVDFSGDTIDIIDPDTGEVHGAKLFVAAMGASSYTYTEAVASERLKQFLINLTHLTLPEIKNFNALDDAGCFELNQKRYRRLDRRAYAHVQLFWWRTQSSGS